MLLASSIAVTEYVSHVPEPFPEDVDDETVADDAALNEGFEEASADAEAPAESDEVICQHARPQSRCSVKQLYPRFTTMRTTRRVL